jgi:phytoene synthase
VYLPLEDLEAFGVTADDLHRARRRGHSEAAVRALIRFEVGRARAHYARAAPGVPMLAPASQACIRTAFRLYAGILDQVEKHDHEVFGRRAVVPGRTRVFVVLRSLSTPAGRSVAA